MGRRLLLTCFLLLSTASGARADGSDDHIRAEMERHHIPGLAFAVVRDRRVVEARGYGYADLEHRVRVTPHSLFEVGSISKQFAAAAVMLLVEEGKLRLDDRLSQHLPTVPEAWKAVTLRQLLTHTSGIPNYNEGEAALALLSTDPAPEKVLALVSGRPLEFEPGSRWAYSNTGYFLAGLVLERVTGRTYWDLVRERLFEPLGMTSTQPSDPKRVVPHRVRGYGWNEAEKRIENREAIRPRAAFAAGGFLSNVYDMAKWEAAFRDERLLKRSSLEQMWSPARLSNGKSHPYGLGWELQDVRGVRTRGHAGGTPGFNTDFRMFGDGSLTVILLTNQRNIQELGTLLGEIAGRHRSELLPLHHEKPRRDPHPARTRLIRDVLDDWATGRTDSPRLTPGLRALLSPAFSAITRGRLEKLERFEFLRARRLPPGQVERLDAKVGEVVSYRMMSGGQKIYYTFYLAEDGRVGYFQSSLT